MTEKKKPKFVFECQRTGRCCEQRQNIEVFLPDIERWGTEGAYNKIIPELDLSSLPNGMPMGIFIKKKEIKGKYVCVFLEDKECTIYNSRPIACVAYPLGFNGENYTLLDKDCPGLNKGTMRPERLIEMREAARNVHESRIQMIRMLPILQAVIVKRMIEESERMMANLSDEEKKDLDKMIHKKGEKKETEKKEKKAEKKKPKKKKTKRKKKSKSRK